jgi:gamma-butyrobetaine dioxygenase
MSAEPSTVTAGPIVDMSEFAPYATAARLTGVEPSQASLVLTWDDGTTGRFHHLWLRDHCACPACRHPQTRERLVRIIDLPETLPAPAARIRDDGALAVDWPAMPGFEAHTSTFDPGWLRQRAGADAGDPLSVDRKTPWDASIGNALPEVEHGEFMHTDAGLARWLDALGRYGFVVLRNGPAAEGEVLRVAERVGWPRETNFGRHFDVISKPEPNNAAYTAVGLEPHADLPNWQRPPDFQLLYCLENEAEGGESTLTDGLAVANALREADPEAYRTLSELAIDFRFQDETSDIAWRAPVIGCDERGDPVVIRFNNWIRDTLRLPPAQVEAFYRAYRRFWLLLRDPAYALRFMLRPGEMIAFDNLRVLHGREAFDPGTGHRHLQGTYLDRDLVRSRQRVLER